MSDVMRKSDTHLALRRQVLEAKLRAHAEETGMMQAELDAISAEQTRRRTAGQQSDGLSVNAPVEPPQPSLVTFAADAIAKNIC